MSETIKSYKDLKAWQQAMILVETAYGLAGQLPDSEKHGLRSQMTRAAVSVPANIAEGHGSYHRGVFLNHLSISRGSLTELETYVLLTVSLKFLRPEQVQQIQEQIQSVGRLINALMRALRSKDKA
jgi:four helix bundle protein